MDFLPFECEFYKELPSAPRPNKSSHFATRGAFSMTGGQQTLGGNKTLDVGFEDYEADFPHRQWAHHQRTESGVTLETLEKLSACAWLPAVTENLGTGSRLFIINTRVPAARVLRPHGLQPARLLSPRHFWGKSTGVGCHFLQGIFPTQGLNPDLLHGRRIIYQ